MQTIRKSQWMRVISVTLIILGAIFVGGLTAAVIVFRTGLLPMNADRTPPVIEAKMATMALQASIAYHAKREVDPRPSIARNPAGGQEIYRDMCARCHGSAERGPTALGSSFYPPAPNLPRQRTQYNEAELFWTIKHGIRNTGMPGWGKLLSDDDIWQVVLLIKAFDVK